MLTKGQAASLVLSLVPNVENRAKAKEIFHDGQLDVTYVDALGPDNPIAMGITTIELNPFRYKSYHDAPPTSPALAPTEDLDSNADIPEILGDCDDQVSVNYRRPALWISPRPYSSAQTPQNSDVWDYQFLTTKEMFQIMQAHVPMIETAYKERQFSLWIGDNQDHFGNLKRKRVEGKVMQGRHLWVLKDFVQGIVREYRSNQI
ncbi:unnamed protein product [Absidia cylindrospora]